MSTDYVPEISTEVSMLSSKPQPIAFQSSCASGVNTNSPMVPELQVRKTEPLASQLTELTS